eukprot:2267331-Amphidinium_carterae.1
MATGLPFFEVQWPQATPIIKLLQKRSKIQEEVDSVKVMRYNHNRTAGQSIDLAEADGEALIISIL